MRLRQIEVFHAIYSSGSVTAAAEALNVSQPSVSKVLAHAEQELGFNLFDRVKGKLVATPEAIRLFSQAVSVYDSVDKLRHVAENLRLADTGAIRIATTPAFGVELLPKAIASYRKKNSGIVFRVETLHHDEICKALLESRIDIGVVFDPTLPPGIVSEMVARGRFVALIPESLGPVPGEVIGIKDLARHPFIKLDGRGPLGRLLSGYLQTSAIDIKPVAYAETYHVAKALVSHGTGVTITDEITAYSGGHEGICILPLEPALKFRVAFLRIASAPLSLVSQNFVAYLRSEVLGFLDRSQMED